MGKDIAYHLWKFGLLGRDFGYEKFFRYSNGHECWISAEHGEADHPHFGSVAAIYNVIDSRQSDPQNTVVEAIRLLGHPDKAEHYTHFSYEMVALTPRCAMELGYEVSAEDAGQVVHRGFRPQRIWGQGRRPARRTHCRRQEGSRQPPPGT